MDNYDRAASATIRGYNYQFDATILAILRLAGDDQLLIEGLEDFDISSPDSSALFQCKYYAAQKLTNSVLRDTLLPMLHNFLACSPPLKKTRTYHVYGHFKDSVVSDFPVSVALLKACLVRKERTPSQSGDGSFVTINIQEELNASDDDLVAFAKSVKLHLCSEYFEHQQQVIQLLQSTLKVSSVEAENYLYPSAFTFVSSKAAISNSEQRNVSRQLFLNYVRPSRTLYNAWELREKGEAAYCANLRRRYFSSQNIDALQRFFVVETPFDATTHELASLTLELRKKWSSHSVVRKPPTERYAPFLYFRGLSPATLVELQHHLYTIDVRFVDGYPFKGASFLANHVCRQQTSDNKLSLRFLSSDDELLSTLNTIASQAVVFEFFIEHPTTLEYPELRRAVIMPVPSIGSINAII